MGWEPIFFKNKYVEQDNQIISWLQKYMEMYLSQFEHPDWFREVLEDLHSNFHVAHRKYFFSEEVIDNNEARFSYCLKMLDLTISNLKELSKANFFAVIRDELKGSWCDISNSFYDDEWLKNERGFQENYLESLKQLRQIMLEANELE